MKSKPHINKIDFKTYVQPTPYALETLINGNISHCIEYVRGLLSYGINGIHAAHDALVLIKEDYPASYNYIKTHVFCID